MRAVRAPGKLDGPPLSLGPVIGKDHWPPFFSPVGAAGGTCAPCVSAAPSLASPCFGPVAQSIRSRGTAHPLRSERSAADVLDRRDGWRVLGARDNRTCPLASVDSDAWMRRNCSGSHVRPRVGADGRRFTIRLRHADVEGPKFGPGGAPHNAPKRPQTAPHTAGAGRGRRAQPVHPRLHCHRQLVPAALHALSSRRSVERCAQARAATASQPTRAVRDRSRAGSIRPRASCASNSRWAHRRGAPAPAQAGGR